MQQDDSKVERMGSPRYRLDGRWVSKNEYDQITELRERERKQKDKPSLNQNPVDTAPLQD